MHGAQADEALLRDLVPCLPEEIVPLKQGAFFMIFEKKNQILNFLLQIDIPVDVFVEAFFGAGDFHNRAFNAA
jgi:hypothetical protein